MTEPDPAFDPDRDPDALPARRASPLVRVVALLVAVVVLLAAAAVLISVLLAG